MQEKGQKEVKVHTITVTVYDKETAFNPVSKLLHDNAKQIKLRIGYPMPEKNLAIIFLVLEMTTDELGAFTGKLGQIRSVKVKSSTLKLQ